MSSRPLALVTGASAGIGREIARILAVDHDLILTARRETELRTLAAELAPAKCHVFTADLADPTAPRKLFETVAAAGLNIDVLVNNAGFGDLGPFAEADLAKMLRMIQVNVMALTELTGLFLPGLWAKGRGQILNLGSVAGRWPYAGGNVYGATKAFVRQFSLNLRADLHGTPVRVTDIEPGLCGGTEFSNVRFRGDDEKAANVYQNVQPLTAEDIADSIYWIATRPAHVNINTIELMPVAQSFAGLNIYRG